MVQRRQDALHGQQVRELDLASFALTELNRLVPEIATKSTIDITIKTEKGPATRPGAWSRDIVTT